MSTLGTVSIGKSLGAAATPSGKLILATSQSNGTKMCVASNCSWPVERYCPDHNSRQDELIRNP